MFKTRYPKLREAGEDNSIMVHFDKDFKIKFADDPYQVFTLIYNNNACFEDIAIVEDKEDQ